MNPSDLTSLCDEMEGQLDKAAHKPMLSVYEYRLLIAAARSYLIAREALEEIQIGSLKNGKWVRMDKDTCREVADDALKEIDALVQNS